MPQMFEAERSLKIISDPALRVRPVEFVIHDDLLDELQNVDLDPFGSGVLLPPARESRMDGMSQAERASFAL